MNNYKMIYNIKEIKTVKMKNIWYKYNNIKMKYKVYN